MLIKTIEELTKYFNERGDKFIVENGNWIGEIVTKDVSGITINMYCNDEDDFLVLMTLNHKPKNYLVRERVFFAYTYACNWYINIRCKDCKYHCYEEINKGYVCVNNKSKHIADWTEDNDYCEFFKTKL